MRIHEILTEATVTVYHGSQMDNPNFVLGHTGENSTTFGSYNSTRWGVFFTDNIDFARMYGKVNSYNITINNTLDLDKEQATDVIYEFSETLDPHNQEERPIWLDVGNVLRGYWQKWQLFEEDLGEVFVSYLQSNGFDSAKFTEYNKDDNDIEHKSNTIVVFNPSNIHIKN